MEPSGLLTIYIGALSVMCFSVLWLAFHWQDRNRGIPYEPLIGILNGIVSLVLLIITRTKDQPDSFWNPVIQGFPIILFCLSFAWLLLAVKTSRGDQRRLAIFITVCFVVASVVLSLNEIHNTPTDTISVLLSDVQGKTGSFEKDVEKWEKDTVKKFEKETRIKVKLIPPAKESVKDRLEDVQDRLKKDKELNKEKKELNEKNAPDHVDVIAIDVIWPKILAEDAVDLKGLKIVKDGKSIDPSIDQSFPKKLIENNTVGGKLIAAPWFIDMGLLFYRPDLLEKYNYGNKPPETWKQLTEMAKKIQAGERKKNPDFWGFIWQGVGEGLTCNALEWQFSYGGGKLLTAENTPDINVRKTEDAFKEARSWIQNDKISPPDLRGEKVTRNDWILGNAAFMRHWPSTYRASLQATNSKITGGGKVGVALLPKLSQEGRRASVLGGWQLMVNAHSDKKHQEAARKFVEFLISEDIQKQHAMKTGRFPALNGLMKDGAVQEALRFVVDNKSLEPIILDAWDDVTVERPSTTAGEKYKNLSEVYSKAVTNMLLVDTSSPSISEQLKELKENIRTTLNGKS